MYTTQQINPQRKMFTTTTSTTERDETSKSIASDCRARLPEAKSTCVWTIAPARYLFRHQHVWPKKIAAKYQRGGAHTKKKKRTNFHTRPRFSPFVFVVVGHFLNSYMEIIVEWIQFSTSSHGSSSSIFFVFCYPHRPKDNTHTATTIKWIKHWPIKAERQYTRR